MIDTHTHLYLPEFEDGGGNAINRSIAAGIKHVILPNVDSGTIEPMKKLHQSFPDYTSMAIGLHPTKVKENWEEVVELMERELKKEKYAGVGEIGIDLYWDKTFITFQKAAFDRQLHIADREKLPVIIHCRDAINEILEIIENNKPETRLIFHSFTGNKEDVAKIRKICDPYFGINGVVTYKNAEDLRRAIPDIGLDRLLLETDSPYLTPVPYRGKRNESSYLSFIRNKIAETIGETPETIEKITDKNACSIFNIE